MQISLKLTFSRKVSYVVFSSITIYCKKNYKRLMPVKVQETSYMHIVLKHMVLLFFSTIIPLQQPTLVCPAYSESLAFGSNGKREKCSGIANFA